MNNGWSSMGSGSREALEHRGNLNGFDANFAFGSGRGRLDQIMDKEAEVGVGDSRKMGSIGSVSVGGKLFNLPK
jgi:hypothetical protein